MSNRSYDKRGWIEFEKQSAALTKKEQENAKDTFPEQVRSARANLNSIVRSKITNWIENAEIANNAKNTQQQNYQQSVTAVLSQKKQLDMLINMLKTHLKEIKDTEQLTYINSKEIEINALATALDDKQGKGKGPVKKRKTNRRRNRCHNKSTRRRRRKH